MSKGISVLLKKRMLVVMGVIIVGFIGMSVRLGYVQIFEGKMLDDKASEQQTRNRTIAPTRGNIYDRNLEILAKSASVATIGVVHAQIQDPEMVAKALSERLGLDYDKVYKKVTKRVAFERIATKVDKEIADQIRELNLPGVKVDEDSKRY